MMPIQNFHSFQCMTSFCHTLVPESIWKSIQPYREDDERVKEYGTDLCIHMCRELMDAGVRGFHFYTLNLEQSVLKVIESLGMHESPAANRYVVNIHRNRLQVFLIFLELLKRNCFIQ